MAKRRDPSITDIVRINSDSLTYKYIPRYHEKWDAVAYVKGHNGHYYIMKGWHRTYILRLYTKNQLTHSDILHWSVDESEVLTAKGQLTVKAMQQFIKVVTEHRPFHYVPKDIDRQVQACYRWEANHNNKFSDIAIKRMTQDEAKRFVKHLCAVEGVRVPELKFSRKGNSCWARGDHSVKMLTWADGTIHFYTLLHEMAHIVDYARGRSASKGEPGHGPHFIGIDIEFMVKYGGADRGFLERTAKDFKLKFNYDRAKAPEMAVAA